jgi:hypothetical protein
MIRVRCALCGQSYPQEDLHWCAEGRPRDNKDWLAFDEKEYRRNYMRPYMRKWRAERRAKRQAEKEGDR